MKQNSLTLLGSTGLYVSPIGLGTVKFGRNQAVKFPKPFDLPSDHEIQNLLSASKELGINLLDTAPAYGSSEIRLGQMLKARKDRADWVIVTKAGEEFSNGNSTYDFSDAHTRFSIERSLKSLQTDYLDIVLLHSDGNDIVNMTEFGMLDCLQALKQEGKIRAIGVSTKTLEGGIMAVDHADLVMVTYNSVYTDELPVIQHAHQKNKGVLIKKALMSGHIDKMPGKNPVQTSLQFIFQQAGVHSVIIGSLNAKHLKEAVEAVNL